MPYAVLPLLPSGYALPVYLPELFVVDLYTNKFGFNNKNAAGGFFLKDLEQTEHSKTVKSKKYYITSDFPQVRDVRVTEE